MPDTVVTLENIQAENAELKGQLTEVTTLLKEIKDKKPEAPYIRKGENVMSSRYYSFARQIRAMRKKAQMDSDWASCAKVELEIGRKLKKETDEMCGPSGSGLSDFCAPLSSGDLPVVWDATQESGDKIQGYSRELVKEVADCFQAGFQFDPDEANHYGMLENGRLEKASNMMRNSYAYGGALVPPAVRGEMIEVLRNTMSLTSIPGTRTVPLPPQGTIVYPRQTSIGTVSAYVEGEETSAMDITFGEISMSAKKYSALYNVTEDLLRAASGSFSVESMMRFEMAEELARQPDYDMIYGPGGKFIRGILNIPNIMSYVPSTEGANGDTLWPEDLQIMVAQMAGRNAYVKNGVALLMRPEFAVKIKIARDAVGEFLFVFGYNNQTGPNNVFGLPIYESTNLHRARRKGSATDLDHVIAVIPSEIMIGQSGVMDFSMTDSDGTNFRSGLKTVRAVTYLDVGVRHETSIAHIDFLKNVRTGV